ncbi:MAG: hypothetical protein C4570_06400 [Ammonifex sp.]|nr:MAG: hypothetical protein C4570_06400 [Ammonifex sp.]
MAQLTVQNIALAGLTPSYAAAAAGGDNFTNDGRAFLHVKNGSASSINVTVDSAVPCNQGFDHDITVAVAAGADKMIGPFDPERFNDSTGKVNVTYSAVTTVTVAALHL